MGSKKSVFVAALVAFMVSGGAYSFGSFGIGDRIAPKIGNTVKETVLADGKMAAEDPLPSIVNGIPASGAEYQGVVHLSIGCTGTFIHPNYILTAAHCVPECFGDHVTACTIGDPQQNSNWVGIDGPIIITARDGLDAGTGGIYRSDRVFFPKPGDLNGRALPDIALFHTSNRFNGQILPVSHLVELPGPSKMGLWIGKEVEMAGYSPNGGPIESAQRHVGTAVVQNGTAAGNRAFLTKGVSNTCFGDSGGPALSDQFSPGRLEVIGVSSFLRHYDRENDCFGNKASAFAFIPLPLLDRAAADDPTCPHEYCGGQPGNCWHACVYTETCGDGICNAQESCTNCAQDCGQCPPPPPDDQPGIVCPDGQHCCEPNPEGALCLYCVDNGFECP